jgi:hypothetical protein
MADPPPARQNDRIHGSECASNVGELVKQRDHYLLARAGDIDAGEAHAFGRGQELGQSLYAKAELLDIDETIDVAQSVLVGFALVHSWCQRSLNRRPDEADQEGGLTPCVGHVPSSSQRRPRRRG